MPMNCDGRLVAAASLEMEIDEVLLAIRASGFTTASIEAKIFCLRPMFSVAASITRSQSASAFMSVEIVSRARVAALSVAVIFCLLTMRSRLVSMVFMARSSAACAMSVITTGKPAVAQTCAMPLPMVPAPMTPIVLMSIPCSSSCRY